MFKRLGQLFIILFMVFGLSANVYAEGGADPLSDVEDLQHLLDTSFKDNDYFHHILEFMWGDFIFDNRDGGMQISPLSKVVGFINVLALILGIVIVTYVSMGSVINSASSGEVLGKSWSTYWLPLRTAASFGLIIPSSAGAYTLSTVQVLVIKLIIIASTSASFLWSSTVNDFFAVPNSRQILETAGYPYQTAYDVSSMAFCSAAALYVNGEKERAWWFDSNEDYNSSTFIKIIYRNGGTSRVSSSSARKSIIDGSGLSISRSSAVIRKGSLERSEIISRIAFADGQCGSISFDFPNSLNDSDYDAVEWYDDAAPSGQLRDLELSNEARIQVIKETQRDMLDLFEKVFDHAHFIAGQREDDGVIGKATFDKIITAYLQFQDPSSQNGELEDSEIAGLLKNTLNISPADNLFVYTENFIDDYRTSIKKVYDEINSEEVGVDPEEERLTKGGWVLAGAAYFKMSDYVSIASESFAALSNINPAAPNVKCEDPSSDNINCVQKKYLDSSIAILDLYYSTIYRDVAVAAFLGSELGGLPAFDNAFIDGEMNPDLEKRLLAAKSASMSSPTAVVSKGNPEEVIDAQNGSLSRMMFSFIELIGEGVGEDVSQLDTTSDRDGGYSFGNANPYQDAIMLGHGMNTIKVMAYALSTANNVSIQLAQYAQSATSGVVAFFGGAAIGVPAAMIEGVLEAFMPVLFAVISLSTTLAWTLAFYLPMMPVILWTVLVSAYCLIVIEAVIAAPLAVILAATPEGEGIAGQRMESAIKMLAAVLLRPSLMVMGLFASIYIAKISYIVFITLFWPQATVYVGEGLFSTFAIIVIYVTVLHQILSRSIMVMDTLPSSILQWIGGGGQAEFGQQGLQSISQIVEGGGSSLQSAGGDFMKEARRKRNMQKAYQNRKSQPKEEA